MALFTKILSMYLIRKINTKEDREGGGEAMDKVSQVACFAFKLEAPYIAKTENWNAINSRCSTYITINFFNILVVLQKLFFFSKFKC